MLELKKILDKLPFNNAKTWIGYGGTVLVLGLFMANVLDKETSEVVLGLLAAWTGVALTHKELKAAYPEE